MSTAIEWADETWNPVVGCMKVSAGCEHCYAIRTAYRLEHAFKQPQYQGLTRKLPDGSVNWTGAVRCLPDRLRQPQAWQKPRRVFVNSMSDLFHEDVPDAFVLAVWMTMAEARQHVFQVLTKRPERMRDFVADLYERIWDDPDKAPMGPLPNVWLGVSTEDQRTADERIPLLLDTPAAVRFLSCEPLLGPVDIIRGYQWAIGALDSPRRPPIQWVIAGGESGPGARPMLREWAVGLRDQCQQLDVSFFFKQWGGRTPKANGRELDGRTWDEYPVAVEVV